MKRLVVAEKIRLQTFPGNENSELVSTTTGLCRERICCCFFCRNISQEFVPQRNTTILYHLPYHHTTQWHQPSSFTSLCEQVHSGFFWKKALQWISFSSLACLCDNHVCINNRSVFWKSWMSTQSKQVCLFFRVCSKAWHCGGDDKWKPLLFLSLRMIKAAKHKTDCQRFISDLIHDGDWHHSILCALTHTLW